MLLISKITLPTYYIYKKKSDQNKEEKLKNIPPRRRKYKEII
jgi:hypothetical protein